jgi:hypothetical protein
MHATEMNFDDGEGQSSLMCVLFHKQGGLHRAIKISRMSECAAAVPILPIA